MIITKSNYKSQKTRAEKNLLKIFFQAAFYGFLGLIVFGVILGMILSLMGKQNANHLLNSLIPLIGVIDLVALIVIPISKVLSIMALRKDLISFERGVNFNPNSFSEQIEDFNTKQPPLKPTPTPESKSEEIDFLKKEIIRKRALKAKMDSREGLSANKKITTSRVIINSEELDLIIALAKKLDEGELSAKSFKMILRGLSKKE